MREKLIKKAEFFQNNINNTIKNDNRIDFPCDFLIKN